MALRFEVSSPDVAATIRGSRKALRAIAVGVDPIVAAATEYVRLLKAFLSLPGTGIRRRGHTASSPGEPPAPDEGLLRAGVGFTVINQTTVGVGIGGPRAQPTRSGRPVWEILERGSRFIDPRPFVRPAIAAGAKAATDAVVKELRDKARKIAAQRRASGRRR